MGIRNNIDESDRDLNRDMYPNRTKSNRFNLDEEYLDGSLGSHLRGFYGNSSEIRRDGYGERNDYYEYSDFTPKDITGSGKTYFGKGPKNYVRKSEVIEEDIVRLFTRDRRLDATLIDVNVVGDEVHLAGWVDARIFRWIAEDLAAEVPGVRKIINQIKIRDIS